MDKIKEIDNRIQTEEQIKEKIFCDKCPRHCKKNNAVGFCGVKNLRIARFGKHMWEEPIISGNQGSGTIFFSGCNLRCVYCQNYEVSKRCQGEDITAEQLAFIFKKLEQDGVQNINLVTPSHYVSEIISALDIYRPNIPIVYNTSSYDTISSLRKLEGYIDVYLADMKYFSSDLASKYSLAEDYPEIAKSAILEMRRQQPNDEIVGGIMYKGLLIRHLVLPNCYKDSLLIIKWIRDNLGKDIYLSVMSQYTPYGNVSNIPELNRKLKNIEYKIVLNALQKADMKNVFIQAADSSSEKYIPEFYGEKLY